MTMDKAKLEDLRKRVEEASGPDREIDAEIAAGLRVLSASASVHSWAKAWEGPFVASGQNVHLINYNGDVAGTYRAEQYTASLDAALALVGEKLPGWSGMVDFGPSEMQTASIWGPVKEVGQDIDGNPVDIRDDALGEARTPALALLSALLDALSALEVSHG